MKPWARLILSVIVCCLAFSAAYFAARQASGQEGTVEEATPTAVSTSDPESTALPVEEPTPGPVNTPGAARPFLIEEMGELAPAGTTFERWGVRFELPSGLGDFRVIYPIIVDGPGTRDWGNNVIMTIYNIQTGSSLFLGFEETADGPQVVERGRYIKQAEASAALDVIISTAEVSAQ